MSFGIFHWFVHDAKDWVTVTAQAHPYWVFPIAFAIAFAAIAPGTLASLATYAHHDKIAWQLGLPLCAGALLTMRAGVALAHKLPERKLRMLFYVPLAGTAVAMLTR